MQEWFRERFAEGNALGDLIVQEDDTLPPISSNLIASKVHESFSYVLETLWVTEVISDNQDISLAPGDVLRPDFLLYSAEAEAIVVVELKNISQPTRQAGTEISAYGAEVKTYLPFIADTDVVGVIVSRHWPTLLRHYVVEEIFWRNRKLLCLEPEKTTDGIKLRVKSVNTFAADDLEFRPAAHHLGGFQICLYDDALYGASPDRARLVPHENQMRSALRLMGGEGESLGSHGFAFLWRDGWTQTLAPYSISVCNIAPFKALERFVLALEDGKQLEGMREKFCRMAAEYDPGGQPQSFSRIASSADVILKSFCKPRFEGYTDWDGLKETMRERGRVISFQPWGIFRNLFFSHLHKAFESGLINTPTDDPNLGLSMLDEVVSKGGVGIDWSCVFYEPKIDGELPDDWFDP